MKRRHLSKVVEEEKVQSQRCWKNSSVEAWSPVCWLHEGGWRASNMTLGAMRIVVISKWNRTQLGGYQGKNSSETSFEGSSMLWTARSRKEAIAMTYGT